MTLSTCFCDASVETVDVSRKAASSEPPRRLLELGVLGTLTRLLAFEVGSELVEVVLRGHMFRRPKTAFKRPHPDFFSSGEESPISCNSNLF